MPLSRDKIRLPMRKSVGGFIASWGIICSLGCRPPFQNRVADVSIAPTRMVVLPAVVKTYELDASDDRTEHRDESVHANIDAAVRAHAAAHGIRALTRELDDQDQPAKLLYARLWRWIPKASLEIAAQQTGRADFGLHSVGDWQFPGNLSSLSGALQADAALTVFVKDTQETTGRTVAMAFVGGHTYWKKVGVACLVSLHDGRMIWCDSRVDAWSDLKVPGVATAAVGELLAGLSAPRATSGAQ
jgi:hypothetical protein